MKSYLPIPQEQRRTFKNVNIYLNTIIYSNLEPPDVQSFNTYLNGFFLVMRVPGRGPEHRESE